MTSKYEILPNPHGPAWALQAQAVDALHRLDPRLAHIAQAAVALTAAERLPHLLAAQMDKGMAAEAAKRDRMTGLDNTRGFVESLSKATAFAKQAGTPLSLIYMYFDNLKHINDTQGHKAGDDAIIEAARLIREHSGMEGNTRQSGRTLCSPARFEAGDEFGVILVDADKATASKWWENMDATLREAGFVMCTSIATYNPPDMTTQTGFMMADASSALLTARMQHQVSQTPPAEPGA